MAKAFIGSPWLLYCNTHAYTFLPDKGSCCVFSTRYNFWDFQASNDVTLQSDHQSYFEARVCCASLIYYIVTFGNVIKNSQEVPQKIMQNNQDLNFYSFFTVRFFLHVCVKNYYVQIILKKITISRTWNLTYRKLISTAYLSDALLHLLATTAFRIALEGSYCISRWMKNSQKVRTFKYLCYWCENFNLYSFKNNFLF